LSLDREQRDTRKLTQFRKARRREKKINSPVKQLQRLGESIPDDVLRTAIAEDVAA